MCRSWSRMGQIDAARELIQPLTSGAALTGKRDWDIAVVDGTRFVLTPTKEGSTRRSTRRWTPRLKLVRKRIDSMGTREPMIIRQGRTAVVQGPG